MKERVDDYVMAVKAWNPFGRNSYEIDSMGDFSC